MTNYQHQWEATPLAPEEHNPNFFSNNGNAITVQETCKSCGTTRWAYYRRNNAERGYTLTIEAPTLREVTKIAISTEMSRLQPDTGPSLLPTGRQADPDRFRRPTTFDPWYL